MKKHRFLSPFLLIFIAFFANARAQNAPDDRIGSSVPIFSFPNIEGKTVTHYDLALGKSVIVFYYDPDCDHCQQEAVWIKERIADFENMTLVFVAFAEIDAIKTYKNNFLGGGSTNMIFLRDPEYKFDKIFGYSEVPTIHIFDSKWIKKKVFRNEVAVDEILNVLK